MYTPAKVVLSSPASISPSFTNIAFTNGFNYNIDAILPPTLTHLTLGNHFAHHLDHLPTTLRHLSLKVTPFQFNTFSSHPELIPDSIFIDEPDNKFVIAATNLPSSYNLPLDHLPPNITHLTMSRAFNQDVDNLPPSLTHLAMGEKFNKSVDHLPPSLIYLVLSSCFARSIDHLPSSLQYLEVNSVYKYARYMKLTVDYLPSSLKYLQLLPSHNWNLDHLPTNLKHLIVTFRAKYYYAGESFDHLPPSLTHLEMYNDLAISIDHLPKTLTHLTIGAVKSLDYLPESLVYLSLSETVNHESLHFLPPNITHLKCLRTDHYPKHLSSFSASKQEEDVGHFPACIRRMQFTISSPQIHIHNSLTHLHLRHYSMGGSLALNLAHSRSLTHLTVHFIYGGSFEVSENTYPPHLTHFKLMGSYTNCKYTTTTGFPQSLEYLHFDGTDLPDAFPPNLQTLYLGRSDLQVPLLPNSLKKLTLGEYFNKPIQLPESLEYLSFGAKFNRKIDLPTTLTHLYFGDHFNRSIAQLPPKLTHLYFGNEFNKRLSLPQTLTHLSFGSSFNQSIELPRGLLFLNMPIDNFSRVSVPAFVEVCMYAYYSLLIDF